MRKQDIQELEFKWTISTQKTAQVFFRHAEKLGARLTQPQTLQIKDYYLDTPDRLFGLCHTSCRLRNQDGHWELTLKSQSKLKNGLASRREKTYSLGTIKSYSNALKHSKEKFLKFILANQKLDKLFEIHNHRTARKMILLDGTSAQICIDDVKIIRYDQRISLQEIELEFVKGSFKSLNVFCQRITKDLSLKRAKISKVLTALKAFSLKTPESSLQTYLFSKYDRLSFMASQVIKKYFETFKFNEPRVRIGMDDEAVHDMRVSARRLRAAIRIFDDVLQFKSTEKAFQNLQWIGHLLGELRDLQLHIKFLSDQEIKSNSKDRKFIEQYKAYCQMKIDQQYERILLALNSRRYNSLVNLLTKLSQNQPSRSSKKVKEAAKELIQKALDQVLKTSRGIDKNSSSQELHRLRISIKKLRYTCEFFKPVASARMEHFIKKTVQLQDLLGCLQDTLTSMRMMFSIIAEMKLSVTSKKNLRQALHPWVDSKHESLKEAHKNFFKKWKKFKVNVLKDSTKM